MKKVISLIISIIILTISINVYGVESQINISGDTAIKAGETGTLTAKVATNGDEIGVISAEITYSENISNIEISGKNNWQITYNETNGKINALKAEGAKDEEFMEIKYTMKSEETQSATIKISNIIISTIEYNSENLNDIVKNITVEEDVESTRELTEISISKKPNKTTYTEGEKIDNEGLVVIAKYNDGTSSEITNYSYSPTGKLKVTDKKVEISYTENSITKTAYYDIVVNELKEETPSTNDKNEVSEENKVEEKLPQTGDDTLIIKIILGATLLISGILLVKYQKMKYLQ